MRILYFDLDSLRPDHLGCYGYARDTSPSIDRVATEGVRFTNCYASDMPCMPSRTSLFSGRFGIRHGCVSHTGSRAEPYLEGESRPFRSNWARTSWMRQLRNGGLRTVTFSGFGERHAAWHWYAGFQEIHDTGHFGHEIADQVTPGVIDWLDRNGTDDGWFLHVNLWDVHVPYRTPEALGNAFADEPLADPWLSQELLDIHHDRPGMRSAQDALFVLHNTGRPDLNPRELRTPADVKLMMDAYDTAIVYADRAIGRILSRLEAQAVLNETAVIVSADHGEGLGELNAYGGHCFADACTARVPLVVRWPGVTDGCAGRVHAGMTYNIDLAATVTELCGSEIPDAWDAVSAAGALRGDRSARRDHLVLSQLAQTCQRAVRFDEADTRYLYVRTYRDGYYLLPHEMLFDLDEDPHELQDLASERPDLVASARGLLTDWVIEHTEHSAHGDPLDAVLGEPPEVTLDNYEGRLRKTGRTQWIAALWARERSRPTPTAQIRKPARN